jgi:predicted nucleotidyltransferase
MLELFNRFKPFFEDTHREYSVREYSRISGISPPSASAFLKKIEKQGIAISREQGIYRYYRANRESSFFRDLAVTYWRLTLKSAFFKFNHEFLFKKPVLFGSIAKAENTSDSDMDIFIDIVRKDFNLKEIEKKLKRKIQIHFKDSLKNENLRKNIERGVVLE